MRKVELHSYMTLDGRAEFPIYPGYDDLGPESKRNFADMWTDHYDTTDTIIVGRRAYEDAAAFWPMSFHQPDEPDFIVQHRHFMEDSQKVVFSNNMKHAEWKNSRIMKGDIAKAVDALKSGLARI